MGMSASQARYLQLTARKNNLEFEAQQICQKRLTLAERTEKISMAYSEKINDRHLYYDAPYTLETALDKDGNARSLVNFDKTSSKRLDYYDITNAMTDEHQPGLGMRIVNREGKIIVAAVPAGEDPDKYLVDPTIFPNQFGSSSLYENACNYLEDKLRSGEWLLQKRDTNTPADEDGTLDWVDTDFYTNAYINDKLYTDNDSAAEATYSAETETIQRQDKMLELRLTQLQSEQKAIETEMDSVKKVIDKNVETTFKTFG